MPILPLLVVASGLTQEAKVQTIDALFSAMRARYVSVEDAARAEAAVRAKLAAHGYDACEDGPTFARVLSEDLRKVCRDAHLGVRYSPDPIPLKPDLARLRRFATQTNGGFQKAERLRGNVGYLRFDGFAPVWAMKGPMKAAMEFLGDTDALIVDLRFNGGGEPEAVRHALGYFLPRRTHINDFAYRDRTVQVWTGGVPGRGYRNAIYVLTGPQTASAAEEFAYDLQALRRGTVVGARTWGGANPGDDVRLGERFSAYVSTGRAVNPITKTNWEGVGVQPDVPAEDALAVAHRLALETLRAGANDPDVRGGLERALRELSAR